MNAEGPYFDVSYGMADNGIGVARLDLPESLQPQARFSALPLGYRRGAGRRCQWRKRSVLRPTRLLRCQTESRFGAVFLVSPLFASTCGMADVMQTLPAQPK